MTCYESLTQRRRKNRNKQKAAANTSKALPEPPKQESILTTFSTSTDGGLETPQSESDKPRSSHASHRHEVQPPHPPREAPSEPKGKLIGSETVTNLIIVS
jgi:hypothetical protein